MEVSAPDIQERGARLLSLLDALVKSDAAAPGFAGDLCIGVRTASRTIWWRGRFGSEASTLFSEERPLGPDTTLLLGEAEAESILLQGSLPKRPSLMRVDGDRSLVERFLSRYARKQSSVALRTGK